MPDSGRVSISIGEIAYWRPDRRLAPYVSGYHRYVTMPPAPGTRLVDVFFPGWINLRFTDGEPWSVQLGRRRIDPVPPAALFGPSSRVGYAEGGAGTMLGIGLTPLGWMRLFGGDASRISNRVLPLETALPAAVPLATLAAQPEPAPGIDAWLLARLADRPALSMQVAQLFTLINDPAIVQVQSLVERTGLDQRRLAALSRRHFGFTPKLLLRRARFLRALVYVERTARGQWADAAREAGYWDGSHFLRDCHLFLDRPLGAFLAIEKPLNRAAAALRAQVLGAPMQSMSAPEAPLGPPRAAVAYSSP